VHIGPEIQAALKSRNRTSKGLVDLLRSEDATWEHEDAMHAEYPYLFEDF
jgi:hypothetical protein